jgi:hypothetical protein
MPPEIDLLERRVAEPADGPADRPEALLTSALAIFERAKDKQDLTTMRRALRCARAASEQRAITASAHPQPTVTTTVRRSKTVISPDPPTRLDGAERCGICKLAYIDHDGRLSMIKVRAGAATIVACPRCRARNPRLRAA